MTQTDNLRPGHKGPRNPEAPEVTVAPTVSAAAGKPAAVPVRVVHRGKAPARVRVTIFGLDARWAPAPLDLGVLQPGDSAAITLTILPERGSLGASYPFSIAAEASGAAAMSGSAGRARPVVGVAESTLVLDAAERVSMSLAPASPSAVFSRGIRVNITNPSGAERTFSLVPSAAAGASLRLRHKSVTIPAQQTVTVGGRVRVKKPTVFGGDNTHTFTVSAQGTGAPEWIEGTLRSTALFGKGLRTIVGLIAVIAVWAALAVVFIPKISDAVKSKNEVTAAASSADGAAGPGAAGANGGAAGDGAGDDTGANGGAGAGADGTAGADGGQLAGGYVVSGTVTGPGAAGASATLQPVSLASAGDDGSLPQVQQGPGTSPKALRGSTSAFANRVMPAVDGSDDGVIGKIRGPVASVNRAGFRTTTLLTTDKGEFTFGGVTAPGYYLLTLSKAGFQTQRFLINSAKLASPQPMKVQLEPGAGKLSGSVTGPGGAIGAATIVVTDGTVTLQTSSISASTHTGTPGTWALDQVSTPGTYLVTASAPGLGSASKLVTLDASGAAQVDLQLSAGQGSIVGKVSGEDSLGAVGGLGGITVTAKGGDITRTATTVTSAAMRGAFVLPNLPAPGDYTLTISGPGFLTQTRDVSLGASGGTVTVNATLSRADAVVAGMVTGLDANGKAEGGLGGVGLTLASNDVTMKTMTTSGDSAGSYQFTGVAPGSYVLTAVQFGRVTASATVELAASAAQTVNLELKADIGAELPATAHIRGQVIDSRSSGPLTCDRALETVAAGDCVATVTVTAPKDPADESKGTVTYTSTATAALNYVYTIPDLNDPDHAGLPPGLYTVTVKAPGYEDTVTHVQVAQGQTMPAPAASMPPLGIISGTVTTRVGTPAQASCVIAVPAGVSIPSKLPTSCALATDGNTCTATGITGAQPCALTSMGGSGEGPIGTYQIRGLTHGRYTMLLIAQDPEFTAVVNAPPIVTLDLGGDGQFNTVLDRLGRINLFVIGQDIVSGALTPAGGVPVKVTPTPALGIDTQNTAADGTLIIKGLNGRYSLAADAADRGSAQVANLAVGLNQEIDLTMTLTRSVGAFIGTVKADINGVKEPVAGVKVTIVGTVDYRSQTAVPGSVTVTTDGDGCYAVKVQATDLAPTNEACTQLAASPGSVGVMSFKSTHVTLNADTAGTATKLPAPMNTEITLGADASKPGTLPTMLLVADPPSFGSHQLEASGPSGSIEAGTGLLDLSTPTTKITVTDKPAAAQTVTITSAVDGTLTFNDSGLNASNKAVPGTYTIQVQRPGFATLTATLTCTWSSTPPAGGNVCVFDKLELLQLPVITGTITVPAPLPSGVTVNNLATKMTVARTSPPAGGTTVTLGTPQALDENQQPVNPNPPDIPVLDGNGDPVLDDNGAPVMEPAPDPVRFWRLPVTYADPANSALAPLPMDMAAPGSYTFNVALSGYATVAVTVECGANYTATPSGGSGPAVSGCTPLSTTLGALPRFNNGSKVTLEPNNNADQPDFSDVVAEVVGQPGIALTVDSAGALSWRDNRSGAELPPGVVAPGDYDITVSKPGYAPVTTHFSCSAPNSGVATCDPVNVTLEMYPLGTGTVHVNLLLPGEPQMVAPIWTDATVTVVSSPGSANDFHVSLAADDSDSNHQTAVMSWKDDSLPASLSGIIRIGTYTINVAIPGYEASGNVTFTCADTSIGTGATCQPTDPNGNPIAIEMNRLPAFSGKVTADPELATGDLSAVTFTVSGLPSGVDSVSLESDENGNLTWTETKDGVQQPTNIVTPGSNYTIKATLTDYATQQSIPFSCASGATTCDLGTITMKKASLLEFVLQSGTTNVYGAKVTFQGTNISATTVQLASDANTYTYGQVLNPDGTVTGGQPLDPDGTYTISVYAAGYEFATDLDATSSNVTCSNGAVNAADPGLKLIPGGTTTCTVDLTTMGIITAHVGWDTMPLSASNAPIAWNALQGVTITATLLDNGKPTTTSFTAQSAGNDGALTLTGNTTTAGLTAGTWRITTASSLTGYQALNANANATVTLTKDTDGTYSVSEVNPSAADGSHSWLQLKADGTVTIHLLPTPADLDIHLNNGTADVLPPKATITITDIPAVGSGTATTSWSCTIVVNNQNNGKLSLTPAGFPANSSSTCKFNSSNSPRYITFVSVPRGTYSYSVTFDNSDYTNISSATLDFTPGTSTTLSIPLTQRSSTVSGTIVDISDSTTPIGGATVSMCTSSATPTTCQSVNNFSGNKVQDTSSSSTAGTLGTFQFTNIKDGTYRLVVSHSGYATTVSDTITVSFDGSNSGITVKMAAATRQNLAMTLTAPSGLNLDGATVTLTQQAAPDGNDGRAITDALKAAVASPVAGTGNPASQYTASLSSVNTGKYDVTVAMNSGQAPFEFSTGSVTVTAGTSTQNASLTVGAATVTVTADWANATLGCVPAPTAAIPLQISTDNTTWTSIGSTAVPAANATTAAGVVYLPAGTYYLQPNLTGWQTTDATKVVIASGSGTTPASVAITPTTASVDVEVTTDGSPSTSVSGTATASCTPTGGGTVYTKDATLTSASDTMTLPGIDLSVWTFTLAGTVDTETVTGVSGTLSNGTVTFNVVKPTTASATVTVTKNDGTTAVDDATVTATAADDAPKPCPSDGADGKYTCNDLTPNSDYTINVTGSDSTTGSGTVHTQAAGSSTPAAPDPIKLSAPAGGGTTPATFDVSPPVTLAAGTPDSATKFTVTIGGESYTGSFKGTPVAWTSDAPVSLAEGTYTFSADPVSIGTDPGSASISGSLTIDANGGISENTLAITYTAPTAPNP